MYDAGRFGTLQRYRDAEGVVHTELKIHIWQQSLRSSETPAGQMRRKEGWRPQQHEQRHPLPLFETCNGLADPVQEHRPGYTILVEYEGLRYYIPGPCQTQNIRSRIEHIGALRNIGTEADAQRKAEQQVKVVWSGHALADGVIIPSGATVVCMNVHV